MLKSDQSVSIINSNTIRKSSCKLTAIVIYCGNTAKSILLRTLICATIVDFMIVKRIYFVAVATIFLSVLLFLVLSASYRGTNTFKFWFRIKTPRREKSAKMCFPMETMIKGPTFISEQNDPNLLSFIRRNGLIESPSTLPYNLSQPQIADQSMGQSKLILPALKFMRNGFFVECGALDGETRSNTLFMERVLGWTGLLIEGDPKNYKMVLSKHRKAWTINACLALNPYPHEVIFLQRFNVGRISSDSSKTSASTRVQCFPFFTLLSVLNVTTVDYFSLDIEGDEMKVLRNIPFEKIFIKTLSVEFVHGEGKGPLQKFMEEKGYRLLGTVELKTGLANDLLFIHRSLTL